VPNFIKSRGLVQLLKPPLQTGTTNKPQGQIFDNLSGDIKVVSTLFGHFLKSFLDKSSLHYFILDASVASRVLSFPPCLLIHLLLRRDAHSGCFRPTEFSVNVPLSILHTALFLPSGFICSPFIWKSPVSAVNDLHILPALRNLGQTAFFLFFTTGKARRILRRVIARGDFFF